jgi:hypothetical protein
MTPGVVKLREPADAIVSRFTVAWVHDKVIERTMRRLRWAGLASVVIAAGSVVATIVLERPPLLLIAATALAIAIALGLRWKAYDRLDIDDRKLRTVLRVLRILRADIPRAERVALTVDLRDYDAPGRTPAGSHFTDDWFRLTTRLADGNVVTLSLTDRIKRKIKRKGRVRIAAHTRLRVALRLAKPYRPAATLAAALRHRSARDGLILAGITAPAANRLVAAWRSPRLPFLAALPAGDALLGALAAVYAGLAAARRPA